MKYIKHISFLILTFYGCSLFGQEQDTLYTLEDTKLKIIAKHSDGGIKLRWAPEDQDFWLAVKDKTFNIYRASFTEGLPTGDQYNLLDSVKLLPATHFESIIDDSSVDQYYKMAGLAAYGEWETLQSEKSTFSNWGQRVQELESRYLTTMFCCDMNFAAAEAIGFAYYDDTIDPSMSHAYKIEMSGDQQYRSVYKVIRPIKKQRKVSDKPILAEGYEKENQVVLRWNRADHKKYTAFYIERSRDGKNFDRLNETPYINALTNDYDELPYITFLDSVENYIPYQYRIKGIDAFGDLSEPSQTQKLMGKDRTPPKAAWVDSAFINPTQTEAHVFWHFNERSPDLDKLIIKKGPQAAGPYYPIAEVSKTEQFFSDKDFSMRYLQYYQVCAVDTAGNENCGTGTYCQLRDRLPPSAPTNFLAEIDSAGIVSFSWDLGPEEDIFGYHVQMSNGKGRVFAPLTDFAIRDTTFRDTITLHTLTESIFYRVTAVDMRDNFSPFSEIIKVTKPDTIPPRPAVFKGYKVEQDQVNLKFSLSSSSDVDSTFLIKENLTNGEVKRFLLDRKDKKYSDTQVASDTRYRYDLLVIDDAGLETYSPQALTVHTKDLRSGHELSVSHKTTEEVLILNLSQTLEGLKYVQIYTGNTAEKQLSQKKVKNVQQDMIKLDLSSYQGKHIKLRCFYEGGTKSKYSNVIYIETVE